jgi:hypothetical protein
VSVRSSEPLWAYRYNPEVEARWPAVGSRVLLADRVGRVVRLFSGADYGLRDEPAVMVRFHGGDQLPAWVHECFIP